MPSSASAEASNEELKDSEAKLSKTYKSLDDALNEKFDINEISTLS